MSLKLTSLPPSMIFSREWSSPSLTPTDWNLSPGSRLICRIDSGGLGIGIDARTSYAAFAASFLSAVKAASEIYPILHGDIADGGSIPYVEDFCKCVCILQLQDYDTPPGAVISMYWRRRISVTLHKTMAEGILEKITETCSTPVFSTHGRARTKKSAKNHNGTKLHTVH